MRSTDPVDLTWLVAEKQVDGEPAVQFERLYHELSAHVPTTFLVVPRHGPRGRFLPVKEPADLVEMRAAPARARSPFRPPRCNPTRFRHGARHRSASTVGRMSLIDILLPRRCGVCGRVGESLCGRCRRTARPLRPTLV